MSPTGLFDPASREKQQRLSRIILIATLAPIPICCAEIIWLVGFEQHPHRVVLACILAAACAVLIFSASYWLYLIRKRRWQGTGAR